MLLTGIKLFFFILSMSGYILYIERKAKIQIEFIPIIIISALTVILFLSGLLNTLVLATFSLFGIGLALFMREIYFHYFNKTLSTTFSRLLTPGIFLFFMGSLYFVFMLKDQRLIHYDNFSHWAVIVKSVLMNDALPNFEDTIIGFNTYPPGSALYIYYFSKIVGVSEGIVLIAQMFILLSGLLALFSFSSFSMLDIKGNKHLPMKKIILTLITLLVSLYLLAGPTSIHNLLVDTLLNTTGLALFSLVYYYFDSVEKITIPVALLISFLTLIKNSGVFFGMIALFIYVYGLIKYRKASVFNLIGWRPTLLLPFVAPVFTNYLWTQHVAMVFQTGRVGKHTMSVSSYIDIFNEKTTGEIQEISSKYLNKTVGDYGYQLLFILSLFIGFIVMKKIMYHHLDKRLVAMTIGVLGIFLLYNLGLWMMYLVSMPTPEALNLAGYGRYMGTIMEYLLGVTAISLVYSVNQSNSTRFITLASIATVVYFTYLVFGNEKQNILATFQRSELAIDQDNISVANIDTALTTLSNNPMKSTSGSKTYYVYYPKEASESIDYELFFLRYRLYEDTGSIIRNFEELESFWTYDYLTVTLVTDEVIDLFAKHSDDSPEIGTYSIDGNEKKISAE